MAFWGVTLLINQGLFFLVQATFCSGESSRDSFSCGVSALAQLLGRVTWCCLFKGMVNDHRRFVALFWGPMSEMSLKCCEAGSSEFFWIRDTVSQYHRTQKDIKLRYLDWWSPKNHGRKLRPRLKAWPLTFSHISHRLPWLLCVTGGSADDTDSTSLCRVAPVWSARKQVSPLCSGPGGGLKWVRSVHLSVFETEHESRGTRRPLPFDVSSSVSQMWYVLRSGTSDPLNASQLCSVIHSKIHCDHNVFWSFLCEGSLICYLTAPAHKIYDDLCSLTIATSLMMLGAGPFIWRQEAARDATRGFVSGGISSARICKQQPIAGRDKSHPFWNGFSSRRCFTMCLDTWTFEILAVP